MVVDRARYCLGLTVFVTVFLIFYSAKLWTKTLSM